MENIWLFLAWRSEGSHLNPTLLGGMILKLCAREYTPFWKGDGDLCPQQAGEQFSRTEVLLTSRGTAILPAAWGKEKCPL